MIKSIIVNLPVGSVNTATTGYAISVAREFGAHLAGIFPNSRLMTSEIGGLGYGFPGPLDDGIGLISPEASKYLLEMYADAPYEEKTEIIHSMLILEDSNALLSLMKQEDDPQLKREMLQILVVMGSDEIDDELFEMLETER